MSDTALIFSIVFFAVFAVYFFFAIYILNISIRAAQNLIFFAVCIALCIWSFGYAMFLSAPAGATALIWARVTAVGWSTLYCLILHFLLILTGRNRLLRKWWFYPAFYAPAVFNTLVFSVLNVTAQHEYDLVRTSFGWLNRGTIQVWDIVFYIYYIGYILAGLLVVWRWKRSAADMTVKRQANLILISFLTALVLGTVTDQILPHFSTVVIPQMAAFEIMFPVIVFYYLVKKHGLMTPNRNENDHTILNEQTRAKLYYYLSASYLLYSLFHFCCTVILNGSRLTIDLVSSGTLLLIGLSIFSACQLKKEQIRDTVILVIMLLSIPLTSILLKEYRAATSWAFPLVLIIVSLIFNRRIILLSVTVMSILTHVLYYAIFIQSPYSITPVDLVIRCAFYAFVCILGLYINRAYVSKLKENAAQIELQKLISGISYDFARAGTTDLKDGISLMLEKVGTFFQASRTFVFLIDHDSHTMRLSYEWCRPGFTPEMELIRPVRLSGLEKWFEAMSDHHTLYHEDTGKLPSDIQYNIHNSKLLVDKDIVTLLSTPIEANNRIYGFLGMTSVDTALCLTDAQLEVVETFANLIADKLIMVKADSDMEYLAYYDQLTGLPNRMLFKDRLRQAIHLAERGEKFLGVVFLDLDSFKAVNDTLGHSGGDALLQVVAEKLRKNLRKSDSVARFGGDEFLMLINNISDCGMIEKIAGNIMRQFESPFKLGEQEYFVTACAGIAVYPVDGEDCETLIKNADIAMYKAKSFGANQHALCTQEMKEDVLKSMMLTNSLYRALERGEFSVEYQPQVRLDTGDVCGAEALIRWQHPKLGKIPPDIFIPLAEKNGLINILGEWVLRSACIQNRKWQSMGCQHCRIAVNLSAVQLRNPHLVETVKAILAETDVQPEYLELEVTESAAISHSHTLNDTIRQLKGLGISISIDDFGTEYSSLKRLKELPVDRIKIDMQFIRGLQENEKDRAITLTIINLARNLGLRVIAEGVETEPQMDFLRRNGCDEIQGYYFYRPMPPDELEHIIRASKNRWIS